MLTKINPKQLLGTVVGAPITANQGAIINQKLARRQLVVQNAAYDAKRGTLKVVLATVEANGRHVATQTLTVDGFFRAADVPQGPPGAPGRRGRDGADGFNGRDGDLGAPGPLGPAGFVGERGERGAQGYPGRKGPQGYKGPRGERGEPGVNGVNGVDGQPGAPGAAGADDDFQIVVSESDPGALGPGAVWVKPSGFHYPDDKVSYTLVASDGRQRMLEIQELYAGPTLPAPWFARDLQLRVDEYAVTDSTFLAAFCDGAVFVVYRNHSGFGDKAYVVKTGGGITEIGAYQGACVVSNVADGLVALGFDDGTVLYNTAFEYVQERLDLGGCAALALLPGGLLAASDKVRLLAGPQASVWSERPARRLLVDRGRVYCVGDVTETWENGALLGVADARPIAVIDGAEWSFEGGVLSGDGRSVAGVDGYCVSDALYFAKSDSVYRLTADGYEYVATVDLPWYAAQGVLVEYSSTAIFLQGMAT